MIKSVAGAVFLSSIGAAGGPNAIYCLASNPVLYDLGCYSSVDSHLHRGPFVSSRFSAFEEVKETFKFRTLNVSRVYDQSEYTPIDRKADRVQVLKPGRERTGEAFIGIGLALIIASLFQWALDKRIRVNKDLSW